MNLTDTAIQAVATLLFALVVAIVGFIITRAVNDGRAEIGAVSTKIDALITKDTSFEVALTELRVRVTQLEISVLSIQRRHLRDEGGP